MAGKRDLSVTLAALGLTLGFVLIALAAVSGAADVPRISAQKLESELGNPAFMILDVRTEHDWKGSSSKIKGAVREDPANVDSWIGKYPKDRTLVLYCA
jgi:hypothetical protein